ncbi:Flp pilus assembly protein CpaB [Bacillus sp. Marseille-P3661]|uniref:Flp pilus assembly protein CpaB n=1 Tax=Bacillus sp. Marseille-P3661 TaxID=1936234 RepID=UPI000C83D8E5|nr:SAF domain-containing protein [Bacillus sp. Marseille-P3661]
MIDAKRKAIIFLTISFLLAVATAGVILVQINDAQRALGEMVKVAAAAKNISSYHEISESDIDWVDLPATSANETFIKSMDELKETITLVELKKGELITDSLVRSKLDIPANERVVLLDATEIVVKDQQLAIGDLVDIIAVYHNANDKVETKRILSNVPVVEVNSSSTDEEEDAESSVGRVKVALPIDDAATIIHHQNTAVQIRVLRVNQASTAEMPKAAK